MANTCCIVRTSVAIVGMHHRCRALSPSMCRVKCESLRFCIFFSFFFFFFCTFYLLSCNCIPVNTNGTDIFYIFILKTLKASNENGRDTILWCNIVCAAEKSTRRNKYRYIGLCTCTLYVYRIGWLTVETKWNGKTVTQKKRRRKIYEYQEKLWSACFRNEQHETKLIIEFIIVFFPHLPFIYFMLRFSLSFSFFPFFFLFFLHQWLLAHAVSFFFFSSTKINFTYSHHCCHSRCYPILGQRNSHKLSYFDDWLSSSISNCTFPRLYGSMYTRYVTKNRTTAKK